MAEILTESFCERCGTRYTFEAAIPKKRRIGRLKVLSKGLKNYVLSEDASLDEALAEARSEEERELSGGQLDAFHQTFQFCMSCRQYTCANCWNEPEGRCLSCAPFSLIGSPLRSPLDDLLAGGGMAPLAPPAPPAPLVEPGPAAESVISAPAPAAAPGTNGHITLDEPAGNGSAWPTIDLFRAPDAESPLEAVAAPVEAPPAEAVAPVVEPVPDAPVADESAPAAGTDPEPATDFWTRPFTGFAPQPEATNGHHVDALPATEDAAPATDEAAAIAEPVEEPEPAAIAEPAGIAEPEIAVEPAAAEAVAEPVIADQAHDPESEARAAEVAAELAQRTSRLLGRFRVSPQPDGATPADQAAQPRVVLPDEQPAVIVVPEVAPAAPAAQPSWMVVAPAPAPEPVEQPAPQALPEPMAWGTWKSEAMNAGSFDGPASVQPPVEPEAADELPEAASVEEPAVAPAMAEPEPVAAAPAAEPAPAPAVDRIEMPAWPTLARPRLSDSAPVPPQPILPPRPTPAEAPQWPAPLRPDLDASSTPFWASGQSARPAGELDVWDASAREVTSAPGVAANPVGVQSCVSCGLSLSATARFCRRCGSRQG